MVRFLLDKNGLLRVEQYLLAPAIYFDHWALRVISEDRALSTRFSRALNSRGGTLILSWLNLAEFTAVSDRGQAEAAEALIEEILPNVFFLEVNPFDVIKREDQLLSGGPPIAPHADAGFLEGFIYLRPQSVRPFTAHRLFTAVQTKVRNSHFESLADTVVERVEALRETMDHDEDFSALVKRLPSGPEIQRGTRYILRELSRTLLVDRGIKMTRNHGIDLMHSVVPVAYADLVLLDKHRESQVERIRRRFLKAELRVPLARVLSRRANGLKRFFGELEEKRSND